MQIRKEKMKIEINLKDWLISFLSTFIPVLLVGTVVVAICLAVHYDVIAKIILFFLGFVASWIIGIIVIFLYFLSKGLICEYNGTPLDAHRILKEKLNDYFTRRK